MKRANDNDMQDFTREKRIYMLEKRQVKLEKKIYRLEKRQAKLEKRIDKVEIKLADTEKLLWLFGSTKLGKTDSEK